LIINWMGWNLQTFTIFYFTLNFMCRLKNFVLFFKKKNWFCAKMWWNLKSFYQKKSGLNFYFINFSIFIAHAFATVQREFSHGDGGGVEFVSVDDVLPRSTTRGLFSLNKYFLLFNKKLNKYFLLFKKKS
jgi:hypothetical protein